MRISNLLRYCVAFVAAPKVDGSFDIRGTGFFLAKPLPKARVGSVGDGLLRLDNMFLYFVTARHVIHGIRGLGVAHVAIRVNVPSAPPRYLTFPIADFVLHPDEDVDYAVIYTGDNAMLSGIEALPWIYDEGPNGDSLKLSPAVGVGSPVSIIGLFQHHYGSERNLPIVRSGNIAAMAEERVKTRMGLMEALLVEARSIGGLSGSPVFVHTRPAFVQANPEAVTGIQLLGLMHGHYDEVITDARMDVRDRINVGIGIVAPASKLRDVMNLPIVLEREASPTRKQQ